MPFIPPMLATRLEDPRRLAEPRYSAEPKLDGQRAQLHVREHRTVHVFSRPGRELIRLPGLAWLRDIRWPVASAVLDGEAVAGDGSEGIQAVFEARHRAGARWPSPRSTSSKLDRASVMGEPWTARRKRLGDLLGGAAARRVPRAGDGRCAGPLGRVGRHGRRGHRAEGARPSIYRPACARRRGSS
jgi:ATP-dependent DNA ligase